jgi:hypothetical protein
MRWRRRGFGFAAERGSLGINIRFGIETLGVEIAHLREGQVVEAGCILMLGFWVVG